MIIYREDQRPIMEYTEGTMAVPAVPGAGKTFVIANLAVKLIKENLNGKGKILIVTYMNSAVNNFKGRITNILKEEGINTTKDFEVMTIHSLAMKILKEKPEVIGIGEDFSIIDEVRHTVILSNILDMWFSKYGIAAARGLLKDSNKIDIFKNSFFGICNTLIGELKLNSVDEEALMNYAKELPDYNILKWIAPVYRDYTKVLKLEGYIDYNDLLILALKALESDEELREKLQKRYSYVFEDECQDSNKIQGTLLSMISERTGNLVRVGDVNQSITGTFTSSDPEFFMEFCKDAKITNTMDMANRSSEEIIFLANTFMRYVKRELPALSCRDALVKQVIRPVGDYGGPRNPSIDEEGIAFQSYITKDEEIKEIIKDIKAFKKRNKEKTIGVLLPSNDEVVYFAKLLRKEGIPCDELCSKPLERFRILRSIGVSLNYIADILDKRALFFLLDTIVFTEEMRGTEELKEFLDKIDLEKLIFYDNGIELLSPLESSEAKGELLKKLRFIKEIIEEYSTPLDSYILSLGYKFAKTIEEKAIVQSAAAYVKYLLMERSRNLKEIAEVFLDNKKSALGHICDMVYELSGYEPTSERVTICTYHKSKGLEWDKVYLMNLTTFDFPIDIKQAFRGEYLYLRDNIKNPVAFGRAEIKRIFLGETNINPILAAREGYIRERARLLYVGITRAKEYITFSSYDKNKKDREIPKGYFHVLSSYYNGGKK